jgi:hypothetical protein
MKARSGVFSMAAARTDASEAAVATGMLRGAGRTFEARDICAEPFAQPVIAIVENPKADARKAAFQRKATGPLAGRKKSVADTGLFFEIQILGIVIPHIGLFELRVVEVHFFVLILVVFFDFLRLVFKRLEIVKIVVFGPPTKIPFRVAPARHGNPPPLTGDANFFANISWQALMSTKARSPWGFSPFSDKILPEKGQ